MSPVHSLSWSSAPDLKVQLSLKQKLVLALTAYAAIGFLAWQTLGDEPLRVGQYFHVGLRTLTLVILGLFAFRTLMTWRRYDEEDASDKRGND